MTSSPGPGAGQVTVSWTAPASDGDTPITTYTVSAGTGSCFTLDPPLVTCTVTGLGNGATVTATVRASNQVGLGPTSDPSGAATTFTVPGAPTGASLVPGPGVGQVTVSWTAPVSNGGTPITGYTATVGAESCVPVPATGTSCVVSGLGNGTSVTATVTAANLVGTSAASAPSGQATTFAAPSAPQAVSGTPGDTQVTVSWSAPASNGGTAVTGYTVTTSPPSAGCTTPGTLGCTVTGLTNGTAYTFTVTATNLVGTGPGGTSAAVMPQPGGTAPPPPTGVIATAGDGQVFVRWDAVQPPAALAGPANGTISYTATASSGQTCTTAATACTITGIPNGTTVTVTVTATLGAFTSPASAPSEPVVVQPTIVSPSVFKSFAGGW